MREALRGPREVLELLGDRAGARGGAWLRERSAPAQITERELTEAAGTRDHQGVVAWGEPYRYADAYELAAGERPLLVCLDQVTDPRNLGAVIRSAEGAGASGVVVPAHGSARVTPAVCRCVGGRGRASAGRGRHEPGALPRRDQGRRALGVGRRRRPGRRSGRPTSRRRRARLRRRGQGDPAARAPPCDGAVAIPLPGGSSRSTSASRRPSCSTRRVGSARAEPTLYLFDGHNLLHAGDFARRASSSTGWRASSRCRASRGIVVFDGAATRRARPARGALGAARRHAARAARRRAPPPRAGLPRLLRPRRAWHRGRRCEALLRGVPRDLERPTHAGRRPATCATGSTRRRAPRSSAASRPLAKRAPRGGRDLPRLKSCGSTRRGDRRCVT